MITSHDNTLCEWQTWPRHVMRPLRNCHSVPPLLLSLPEPFEPSNAVLISRTEKTLLPPISRTEKTSPNAPLPRAATRLNHAPPTAKTPSAGMTTRPRPSIGGFVGYDYESAIRRLRGSNDGSVDWCRSEQDRRSERNTGGGGDEGRGTQITSRMVLKRRRCSLLTTTN